MTDLEPSIRRRSLPSEVVAARDEFAEINAQNAHLLETPIAVHLTAYRAALAELEKAHRIVADGTDLDLTGTTRWSALWLMSGRCIAQSRAVLHLLEGGFGNETPALLRQLQESLRLLDALAASGEDAVARKWLANKWVKPADAAAAVDRDHERIREDMIRKGSRPPANVTTGFDRAYGHLSEFAHNRRHRIIATVSSEQRMMPIGPHPDVRHRAATINEAEGVLLGTVTTVGHALAMLLGPEWFTQRFNPTFHALHELSLAVPLPTADEPPPT